MSPLQLQFQELHCSPLRLMRICRQLPQLYKYSRAQLPQQLLQRLTASLQMHRHCRLADAPRMPYPHVHVPLRTAEFNPATTIQGRRSAYFAARTGLKVRLLQPSALLSAFLFNGHKLVKFGHQSLEHSTNLQACCTKSAYPEIIEAPGIVNLS